MTKVLRGHGYKLKKAKELKEDEDDDCKDGRHCQRIVAEEDLGPR
jgi:hypothetical protein